ncbi:signal peptidase II [Ehrlichia ruminantium]|uniref:Lipoprotein signal peptidase n=1 Tax=Ehrlichia ruminantium TaxID=779 RepID=A0AAE6UIU5_EHRRU|nr:signal peptidase II [Ehrlichia ruminantium]QGR02881.1 signal peptidase II [Ehrlichia ruminantium]QGR03805.1 signal peptidase II [Ehrlichia ruminantium]QGR04732.1 signal peptidase II [Ehrlichia ruminantium]
MKKYILIICVLVFIDQISKWYIMFLLQNVDVIEICGFLRLAQVWNTGISFGIMNGFMYSNLVFCGISIVITVILFCFLISCLVDRLSLAMIIGGSIGNIVDRIVYGAVYDFIDVYVQSWHWPAFNFADFFIVLGISIIFTKSVLADKKNDA